MLHQGSNILMNILGHYYTCPNPKQTVNVPTVIWSRFYNFINMKHFKS